jgi:hypothetical protein
MSQQAKVRWGILGAARINQQLMPAIVAASNSELIAIASRRPGAAEEATPYRGRCTGPYPEQMFFGYFLGKKIPDQSIQRVWYFWVILERIIMPLRGR